MIFFTGNARFPIIKPSTRTDGLHATACLINGQQFLLSWKTESDIKLRALPVYISPVVCELTNRDSVIVASCDAGSPVQYAEYAISDLRVLSNTAVGDQHTRAGGGGSVLDDGTSVSITHRDYRTNVNGVEKTDGKIHYDVVAFKSGTYSNGYFNYVLENGLMDADGHHFISSAFAVTLGPDGLVYLFHTNDSSGSIHCARFRIGSPIQMVDHWGVPTPPEQSISGEAPGIFATLDKKNGRIILCYQSVESIYPACDPSNRTVNSAATILMGLRPDKSVQQLARIEFENHHDPNPVGAGFQFDDGLYYITTYFDRSVCKDAGLYRGKVGGTPKQDPGVDFLAASQDGWTITQRPIPNHPRGYSDFELTKISGAVAPAPINYAIEDSVAEVFAMITWSDRKPADCTEFSTDNGVTWQPCFYYQPLKFSTTAPEVRIRVKRA